MNKLESLIYQVVKNNPKVKNMVRDLYQALFSLIPGPPEKSRFPVMVREGYFFGFHDKNPWSAGDRLLLAHDFQKLPNREPRKGDQVNIGFFKGEKATEFQKVATTSCFNWQQGSMLQWVGKTGNFIFNDSGGDDNIARIFDTAGKEVARLPGAIAAVNPGGTMALSYNFARLQRHFPGYGYVHGNDPEVDRDTPALHGISIADLGTNRVTGLFSVQDVASFLPEKSMAGAKHFLTHCLFSPSGDRFIFLHRWVKNDNVTFTRMLSCDAGGKQLHLFPTGGMVSHIAWQDESHIMAWARSPENRDAYILFRDMSTEFRLVGTADFNSDGHPSFAEGNPRWFVTDTYPDRLRRSYLMLYDLAGEKRVDLGYFRQPMQFKEAVRCDLHPRWNHKGDAICFDSAHRGRRSLCTMNIGDLISQEQSNPS